MRNFLGPNRKQFMANAKTGKQNGNEAMKVNIELTVSRSHTQRETPSEFS